MARRSTGFSNTYVRSFSTTASYVTVWSFVGRGRSDLLLRLLLVFSPMLIASFAIGLPFGIKAVALSGSVLVLIVLPCILRYSFRGTMLTLPRVARAIRYPILASLAGIIASEAVIYFWPVHHLLLNLLVIAVVFGSAIAISMISPEIRSEVISLKSLLPHLRSLE